MGELIDLGEVRARRSPRAVPELPRPLFFFDVSCPLSYLMAEGIERRLGRVDWVAVDRRALRQPPTHAPGLRARAEATARALRLPLVWPDRFPGPTPRAQRASAFACEIGAGGAFALAASRLAFCGGFDLEDPEILAEAAAAAGVPLDECLAATRETWRDEWLTAAAQELSNNGVAGPPAIRVGSHWLHGESDLLVAESLMSEPGLRDRTLAPV